MKLDSIKRIQEQYLSRKKKQDVMYCMHLKRLKFNTKLQSADHSSIEAQAKESRRKYLSQRKAVLDALVAKRKLKK